MTNGRLYNVCFYQRRGCHLEGSHMKPKVVLQAPPTADKLTNGML